MRITSWTLCAFVASMTSIACSVSPLCAPETEADDCLPTEQCVNQHCVARDGTGSSSSSSSSSSGSAQSGATSGVASGVSSESGVTSSGVAMSGGSSGASQGSSGPGASSGPATPGITVMSPASTHTTEGGGSVEFRIALRTQPSDVVSFTLENPESGEVSVSPTLLQFTPDTWNMPQVITITGLDDSVDDGDRNIAIAISHGLSGDPAYNDLAPAPSALLVTNENNDTASLVVTGGAALTTTEQQGTATFQVHLGSQPAGTVLVNVMSSDTTEGTVSAAMLSFNATNWNFDQAVTVTGVNDDVVEPQGTNYTVALRPVQTQLDPRYGATLNRDLAVTNADDDVAEVVVSPQSGLVTSESGTTAAFTVVLRAQPLTPVQVDFAVQQPGGAPSTEATVMPASVTFDSNNWDMPVSVTLTGANDTVADGAKPYQAVGTITQGSDPVWRSVAVPVVNATNSDDDTAGISIQVIQGVTSEDPMQPPASFSVRLNTLPTQLVAVTVSVDTPGEAMVMGTTTLMFNSGNYAMPQMVQVAGVDERIDDGDQEYTVTLTAASADTGYQGQVASAAFVNLDDDTAGVVVTGNPSSTVTEAAGATHSTTFAVALSSQPRAQVTLNLVSTRPTAGTVSPATITFQADATDWSTPRTVTVTSSSDAIDDGDIQFQVQLQPLVSSDATYNGMDPPDRSFTSVDDDVAGISIITHDPLITSERGTNGPRPVFTVTLSSEPTASVTVKFVSSVTTEGTVSPSQVTFTPGSNGTWDDPLTFTVTGVADAVYDQDTSFQVQTTTTTTDVTYASINPPDITLTNRADRHIFILPSAGTGNLGGVAGADAKCNAATAGLANVIYKALIADSVSRRTPGTSSWPLLSFAAYRAQSASVPGAPGTLVFVADAAEKPVFPWNSNFTGAATAVWTGLDTDLSLSTNSCSAWTSASASSRGRAGSATQTTTAAISNADAFCSGTAALYCVSVGIGRPSP